MTEGGEEIKNKTLNESWYIFNKSCPVQTQMLSHFKSSVEGVGGLSVTSLFVGRVSQVKLLCWDD